MFAINVLIPSFPPSKETKMYQNPCPGFFSSIDYIPKLFLQCELLNFSLRIDICGITEENGLTKDYMKGQGGGGT